MHLLKFLLLLNKLGMPILEPKVDKNAGPTGPTKQIPCWELDKVAK